MIKIDIQKTFLSRSSKPLEFNFQCEIPLHQTNSLFGESGVGKTTFLKLLSGLLTPDRGFISVDGQTWFDSEKKINLPILSRSIGFLFQESSLYPNMNVRENLEFAFHKGKGDQPFLTELISIAEVGHLFNQKVDGLSGGEKQRLALVRALIQKPKFLFLDEPFTSLDHRIRNQLVSLIQTLQNRFQMTVLLITHEIPEVIKLSKRVFMVSGGQILFSGNPMEIFRQKNLNSIEAEVMQINQDTDEVALWFPSPYLVFKRNTDERKLGVGDLVHTEIYLPKGKL
ncbi:ATP-binding cassette domain-containing protein [Leptospira kanakyensis]|uniref:ATP-binding cassette domain-containing protein n=1 Tax=Leptospira kanakyensis TaxID=2484968 RepID=A0A6N4PW19_9LEPT|nr:ATP-binding cassette domain-containing protein [Leptospira kanakyensis]TGK49203.1 ATP-binding cassette domain-containing protein [Leptospira kanakyensis]TGK60555.1 ATP-binding cassette domain-containing protein [Leptospira kanakyensis]TGK67956.1 ATP-binding cassette domain-containing protein [Leptospira kanakyensis]